MHLLWHCCIVALSRKKIQIIAGHNKRLELLSFATNTSPLTMAYPSSVNVSLEDGTYKLKYVQTPCSQIYVDLLDTAELLTDSRKNFVQHSKRCFPGLNKEALPFLMEEISKVLTIFEEFIDNF
jgi:hypothetical protein